MHLYQLSEKRGYYLCMADSGLSTNPTVPDFLTAEYAERCRDENRYMLFSAVLCARSAVKNRQPSKKTSEDEADTGGNNVRCRFIVADRFRIANTISDSPVVDKEVSVCQVECHVLPFIADADCDAVTVAGR